MKSNLLLNMDHVYPFVKRDTIGRLKPEIIKQISSLHKKTGKGSDFLGWLDLPSRVSEREIEEIEQVAGALREKIDVLVVIGIGGSYLGTRLVIEALSHGFLMMKDRFFHPRILFAGQNISEDYMGELIDILDKKSYAMVVISKSGNTTEPAIAFRILRDHLTAKEGKRESAKRIIAITDPDKGALRKLAETERLRSFIIPNDVGGRYSVLTPVGLFPVAVAGFKIKELIEGAKVMESITGIRIPFWENPAAVYAATRNALYQSGKTIEILVNYNPKLHYFSEWWKQLYGESEGKEGKGIFPASVDFTTDLHSMGQYIQEGMRNIFETILSVREPNEKITIPHDDSNLDNLNYLAGKRIGEVNKMAETGTILAHVEGGVPNIHLEIPELSEFYLGQLIYFFEKACAVSGYFLGINPFDQTGVEAYKKNMFALLGKPGFEEENRKILKKLKQKT